MPIVPLNLFPKFGPAGAGYGPRGGLSRKIATLRGKRGETLCISYPALYSAALIFLGNVCVGKSHDTGEERGKDARSFFTTVFSIA